MDIILSFLAKSVDKQHHTSAYHLSALGRSCESCMAATEGGNSIKCQRFRILLSISDQASAYEKLCKQITQALIEYMNNESTFPFPIVHIHDIGHQVKNSQAALERGTHLDGKNSYDATDFSLIMSTCKARAPELRLITKDSF